MKSACKDLHVTRHEQFWLDVIRVASRDTDPVPTLAVTQHLRRLFEEARSESETRLRVH